MALTPEQIKKVKDALGLNTIVDATAPPSSFWGTSSAEHGQVGETGEIEIIANKITDLKKDENIIVIGKITNYKQDLQITADKIVII